MSNDDYTITISSTPSTGGLTYSTPTYDFSNLIDNQDDVITIDTSAYNPGATVHGSCIHDVTFTSSNTLKHADDVVYYIDQIEEMCKDYPALDKAYENFRTIYKMVFQDWKGKQND